MSKQDKIRLRFNSLVVGQLIADLESRGVSIKNDARYWDLCRTYGDTSPQAIRHLRGCVAYQEENKS